MGNPRAWLSGRRSQRSILPEHCRKTRCRREGLHVPSDAVSRPARPTSSSATTRPISIRSGSTSPIADKVGQYYNATLDEMLHAAKAGLHGLCTNQHHQNVYGFMANPSIMGAVLARQTNGQNVAIIQLGSTLPSTTPPTRIAEEYAMLDCISGGRLVAGFPDRAAVGRDDLQRRRSGRAARALPRGAGAGDQGLVGERGLRLERQALSARHGEPVAAADPAAASADLDSRRRPLVDRGLCRRPRSLLLPSELLRRRRTPTTVSDRYWELCAKQGPRRQSLPLQLPAAHRRRRNRCRGRGRSTPRTPSISSTSCSTRRPHYQADPGLPRLQRHGAGAARTIRAPRSTCASSRPRTSTSAASSSSAARRPCASSSSTASSASRIGHLLALLHFGSMPTELCKKNIDLFAREVLPHLAPLVGRQVRRSLVARAAAGEASGRRQPLPPWPPHPERGGKQHVRSRGAQAPALAGPGRNRSRDFRPRSAARLSARTVGTRSRPRVRCAACGRQHGLCAEVSGHQPRRPRGRARARQLARPRRLSRRAVRQAGARRAGAGRPFLRRSRSPPSSRRRRRSRSAGWC